MPEHDPNGAARRPVLRQYDGVMFDAEVALNLANAGKLWEFVGEFDAKGGETGGAVAADLAQREIGRGVFQVFDAGSWGRGYWRG